MLEHLNMIDWKRLGDERVPEWLRGLASDDDKTRKKAQMAFEDNVVFANITFEEFDLRKRISEILKSDMQLLTVPFLIEILDSDSIQTKTDSLGFLHMMADYVRFDYEGDIYLKRSQDIYSAIWQGFDVYLKLFSHPDPGIRLAAIELAIQYLEHDQQVFSNIIAQLNREKQARVIVVSLRKLSFALIDGLQLQPTVLNEYRKLLENLTSSSYQNPIRLIAAVFLIEHFGNAVLSKTIDMVRNIMNDKPDKNAEPYSYLISSLGIYPFWDKISAILKITE